MYTGQDIKGQTQERPGREFKMDPEPIYDDPEYKGSGRLKDKVAIVTGGDSGIGRAVSVAYAKEGAKLVIVYNIADKDANDTKKAIEGYNGSALLIKGDLKDRNFVKEVVKQTIDNYGKLDILVNNAAVQYPQNKFKGAVTSFTRSLALYLADRKIRVNQVAPGPIWTPLIPSTFDAQHVESFGEDTPLGRPGQPVELAEAYVFLASDGATYITGQTIHVNGGHIING